MVQLFLKGQGVFVFVCAYGVKDRTSVNAGRAKAQVIGMRKDRDERFSREVDGYRDSLLFSARLNDWETFERTAGNMFDYVESIELIELERRFFAIFNAVLAILVTTVVVLFVPDFDINPILKRDCILGALAVAGFELYFFVDYRMYVRLRTARSKRRRAHFVRAIAKDFEGYAMQLDKAA